MGDSLDLGRLADNLPSSNGRGARAMQAAEVDLQSAFRNSALCITQMLKAGQKASKRSYQAGYSTALQDVLEYLQSSLDINVAQQRSNEGIAQVIDYIEARQEAVRLELQDIEADEDQQQQQAQHPSSSASSQYAQPQAQIHPHQQQTSSSSSQSLRSHPHRQQQQQNEQQPQSSTAYRQPVGAHHHQQQQQHSYQPVASSSGTGGLTNVTNQLHSQQHQQQRKQRRSLSPLVSRTAAIGSSPQSAHSLHNRLPVATPSIPYQQQQHRHVNDLEAERTQESIPLASSSSIPNSPVTRFSPDLVTAHAMTSQEAQSQSALPGVTPPPHSTIMSSNTDASLSNASTAVSPLTRLQAKRERERERHHHHHHDRRGRHHGHGHAHDSNNQSNGGGGAQNSASASAATAAGVKRRWTAALLPEHHTINLSMNLNNQNMNTDYTASQNMTHEGELESSSSENEDSDTAISAEQQELNAAAAARGKNTGTGAAGADHATGLHGKIDGDDDDSGMMEMDDSSYRIDGNNRPSKRTARR